MKVNEVAAVAYQWLPPAEKVIKSALVMTVGAIAVESLSAIPSASAGPITYAACILACSFAAPPVVPFCLAACAPSIGPWCA